MSFRVTLGPAASREAFEELAHRSGWMLLSVIEDSDERPYEQIWAIDDGASAAHYLEDPFLSIAYVLTMGQHAKAIAAGLPGEIATFDREDALRWAQSELDDADRVRCASYLAATAPRDTDPAVVAAFARLLGDGDPEVRRAAAQAASYLPWHELSDLLEPLAVADPDEAVRGAAQETLGELRDALGS